MAMGIDWKGRDHIDVEEIGQGSFGKVFKAKSPYDRRDYAIKEVCLQNYINKTRWKGRQTRRKSLLAIKKEVCEFLSRFNCKYVVTYKDCWFGGPGAELLYNELENCSDDDSELSSTTTPPPKTCLYIKMDYCESNLKEWLENNNTLEERKPHLPLIFKHILKGLEYIHSQDVIHRDIKPANIMIKQLEDSQFLFQIGDFGLSTTVYKDKGQSSGSSLSGPIGTRMYMSPEMLRAESKRDYNCKTDIYSAGLVFFEVISPCENRQKLACVFDQIRSESYHWNSECELIKRMTMKEFSKGKRPSATRALKLLQDFSNSSYTINSVDVGKGSPDDDVDSSQSKSNEIICLSKYLPVNGTSKTHGKFKMGKMQITWPINFDTIPATKNFTGREQELKNIKDFYENGENLVLISGLGGIGKTEFCRRFLQICCNEKTTRIWINGKSLNTLRNSVSSLAAKLGLDNGSAIHSSQMLKHVISIVLQNSSKLIIVIDNVDNSYEEVKNVILLSKEYRPNVLMIVTSRDSALLDRAGSRIVLDVLSKSQARLFVTKSMETFTNFEADRICELLEYFPLALQQAVSYIKVKRESWTSVNYGVEDYTKEFDTKKSELLDHKLSEFEDDYRKTTFLTWDITFEKMDEITKSILRILAFICSDRVEIDFLKEVFLEFLKEKDETGFKNGLDIIKRYSLVTFEHSVVIMHKLVQDVTRLNLKDKEFPKRLFDIVFRVWTKREKQLNFGSLKYVQNVCQLVFQETLPSRECESLFGLVRTRKESQNGLSLTAIESSIRINLKWPFMFEITKPNKNFVGRKIHIKRLRSYFENGKNLVLVCGPGGIGKTELCRQFVHNVLKGYNTLSVCRTFFENLKRNLAVVWIHGETKESFRNSVMALAATLCVNSLATKSNLMELFVRLVKMILVKTSKFILVVDNVDTKYETMSTAIQVLSCYENIFLIVTSRDEWILDGAGNTITLDKLTDTESKTILRNSLPNYRGFEAESLCDLVKNHPLSLHQAVAYINERSKQRRRYTVSDLNAELANRRSLDQNSTNEDNDSALTLLINWNVIFDKLSRLSKDILEIVAFLEPDRIEVKFLGNILFDVGQIPWDCSFEEALEMIQRYHLIQVESGFVSIHRLVQQNLRQELKQDSEFPRKLFGVVLRMWRNDGYSLEHVQHITSVCQFAFGKDMPFYYDDEILIKLLEWERNECAIRFLNFKHNLEFTCLNTVNYVKKFVLNFYGTRDKDFSCIKGNNIYHKTL